MKEEKVNNVSVKPVVVPDNNEAEKIKGWKIAPFKYFNMFLVAKKKSGKTSLINTIIKKHLIREQHFGYSVVLIGSTIVGRLLFNF